MTPGSLVPLSPKARALVSVEREILPRPELERRRAAVRARSVLWHAPWSSEVARVRSAFQIWWKRGSLAAFTLLGGTSAFAAWVAFAPADSPDAGAATVRSAPARPVVGRAPPRVALSDHPGLGAPSVPPVQAGKPSPLQVGAPVPGLRPGSPKHRGTSSEELALLDRVR